MTSDSGKCDRGTVGGRSVKITRRPNTEGSESAAWPGSGAGTGAGREPEAGSAAAGQGGETRAPRTVATNGMGRVRDARAMARACETQAGRERSDAVREEADDSDEACRWRSRAEAGRAETGRPASRLGRAGPGPGPAGRAKQSQFVTREKPGGGERDHDGDGASRREGEIQYSLSPSLPLSLQSYVSLHLTTSPQPPQSSIPTAHT